MIRLLFAGDFIPMGAEVKFSSELFDTISDATLSFVNLEAPITNTKKSILKTGNNFRVDLESGQSMIDNLPFNIFCLANNHILDFGYEGLLDTMRVLRSLNRQYIGAGKNIDEAYDIFEYKQDGMKIGFLNVAENEFSIASQNSPGAAGFDLIRILTLFNRIKETYNYLFLIYHGGIEYYPFPSPRIRKLFRFLIDYGFAGIIAHHSHVFSCYEYYKDRPIFYGIGNFYAPTKRIMIKDYYESALVTITINPDEISSNVYPIIHEVKSNQVKYVDEEKKTEFIKQLRYRNNILSDDRLLQQTWHSFLLSQKSYYSHAVDFTGSRSLKKLRKLGLWPQVNYSSDRAITLLNLLRCEAHNEVLVELITRENSVKS